MTTLRTKTETMMPEIKYSREFIPVMGPVTAVLSRAMDLLSGDGKWCKAALHKDGAFCALGGIASAAGWTPKSNDTTVYDARSGSAFLERDPTAYTAAFLLAEVIDAGKSKTGAYGLGTVMVYNDDRATKSSILSKFKRAIKLATERGI